MQIYELEIKNYKCLDNYELPLRLGNLNVLIGENDSGKTSFLEILEILFGEKKINKSMFYDQNNEIVIKVKLKNIDKEMIEKALMIRYAKLKFMVFYEALNEDYWIQSYEGNPTFYENDVNEYIFLEYIERLRDYSFYDDLKKFYIENINNIMIIIETKYLLKDKENVDTYKNIYFAFDDEAINNAKWLISSIEFIDFLNTYLKKFDDKCIEIYKDIIEEWHIQPDDNRHTEQSDYDKYRIRNNYRSIIFQEDNEEAILSKIASKISALLNKNSIKNKVAIEGPYLFSEPLGSGSPPDILLPTVLFYENNFEFPQQRIYKFSTEVINEEVPYKLYDDLLGGIESLKDSIYRTIINYIGDFTNKKTEDPNINKNIIKYLDIFDEKITSLRINVNLDNLDKIKEVLKPFISIFAIERGKEIDISQKGQGFLRKLLISDFLILLENLEQESHDKTENLFVQKFQDNLRAHGVNLYRNNDNSKIILIEEPELHLHSGAQKKIMEILKEKLSISDNQVFITTHSHFIIEDTNFEDIFIFRKNKDIGISKISNIKQLKEDSSIFEDLQSSLGLNKNDLLSIVKLMILVEGKRDKVFIETLCKRPDINISLERVKIINIDGQEKMDYYVKSDLIKGLLNIKQLIILDDNKINRKRKKNLIHNEKIEEANIFLIDKIDILNYLDPMLVEEHYNLKKNSLVYDDKTQKLENILENKCMKIRNEDIEEMVLKTTGFDKNLLDLEDRIKYILNT